MPPEEKNPALESEIGDLLSGNLPTKEESGTPGEPPPATPPPSAEGTPPAEPPKSEPTTPAQPDGAPPAADPTVPPAEPSAATPPAGEAGTPPPAAGTEQPPGETDWKAQVELMQRQLAEMSLKLATPQAPAAPAEGTVPASEGVIEFFKTEEEVDKAFGSAAEVNKFMTSLVNQAVERTLRSVPQLVVSTARQQASLVNAVEKFYDVNQDLVPFKPFVGYVATDLQTKHPDWDAPKLFEEIEKEVRARLNLKRSASAPGGSPPPGTPPNAPRVPQGGGTGPAFVGQHSRARGSVGGAGLSAKEQDILDLITS